MTPKQLEHAGRAVAEQEALILGVLVELGSLTAKQLSAEFGDRYEVNEPAMPLDAVLSALELDGRIDFDPADARRYVITDLGRSSLAL